LNKHEGMYHIHVSNEVGEAVSGIQVNLKGNLNLKEKKNHLIFLKSFQI
jgi:hypothetical protein